MCERADLAHMKSSKERVKGTDYVNCTDYVNSTHLIVTEVVDSAFGFLSLQVL